MRRPPTRSHDRLPGGKRHAAGWPSLQLGCWLLEVSSVAAEWDQCVGVGMWAISQRIPSGSVMKTA